MSKSIESHALEGMIKQLLGIASAVQAIPVQDANMPALARFKEAVEIVDEQLTRLQAEASASLLRRSAYVPSCLHHFQIGPDEDGSCRHCGAPYED